MIALIANGLISNLNSIATMVSQYETIVAVDGGLLHLDKMGIKPHYIIGDLDSCSKELLQKYHSSKVIHDCDPNTTDLEKALNFFSEEQIVVFGALGGRIDHTLTNTILLTRFKGKVQFINEKERLFALDQKAQLQLKKGQVISLIALNGQASGITTKGLKWELTEATLSKSFVGISNEVIDPEVSISCKSGDLLVCLNF